MIVVSAIHTHEYTKTILYILSFKIVIFVLHVSSIAAKKDIDASTSRNYLSGSNLEALIYLQY